MRGTLVETLLGAIVLIVAGWFLYFAFQSTDISSGGGYNISVQFERIDGLTVGSDVRVAGIKVGSVASQTLDPENFAATVVMAIDDSVELPEDTFAKVSLDGLLGGSYIALVPGGSPIMLMDGDELADPGQSAVDLMGLIGQVVHGSARDSD